MADNIDQLDVYRGNPCGVGIIQAPDGPKVVLLLRMGRPDAHSVWLDPAVAQEIGYAMLRTVDRIRDSSNPPTTLVN